MSFGNGPRIVTNGLVLSLDAADRNCYVTSSTTWKDLTGNYSGSLVQSCSFVQGPIPTFFNDITSFQSQSAYLSVTPLIDFFDQTEYTLDFWVKLAVNNDNTLQSLAGRGLTTIWLAMSSSASGNDWYITFRDEFGNYNNFARVSSSNSENWNNITLAVNSSKQSSLYVNGNLTQTITYLTSSYARISRVMGGYQNLQNFYNLQGSMSSAKFYSRLLSPVEIQQNYNAVKSRFNLT